MKNFRNLKILCLAFVVCVFLTSVDAQTPSVFGENCQVEGDVTIEGDLSANFGVTFETATPPIPDACGLLEASNLNMPPSVVTDLETCDASAQGVLRNCLGSIVFCDGSAWDFLCQPKCMGDVATPVILTPGGTVSFLRVDFNQGSAEFASQLEFSPACDEIIWREYDKQVECVLATDFDTSGPPVVITIDYNAPEMCGLGSICSGETSWSLNFS
mmetsp:Transcript_15619/g.23424  ORF Transcript_15619/g.23424 Transcript_15619/m.23424 type:complete len:215 (-) Transcript_15619:49-693(-)